MKVFIGSDHAGFGLKKELIGLLKKKRMAYEDEGTYSEEPVDYPDYAVKVAKKVAKSKNNRGILICGTGTGMAIAANKVKGIRAAFAYDRYSAVMSRKDNDANIITLRGRLFPKKKAKEIVSVWLKTKFSGKQRHKKRIGKIKKLER